jgi:hypothetical protein
MRISLAAAVLGAAALAGGCGGTLEDEYRKGEVPGQTPTSIPATTDPGGALSRPGAGATMAKVMLVPADIAGSGRSGGTHR